MIKNILKLSIATVLLLSTVMGMSDKSVPALSTDDDAVRTAMGMGHSNKDGAPLVDDTNTAQISSSAPPTAGMPFEGTPRSGMSVRMVLPIESVLALMMSADSLADGLFGNMRPTSSAAPNPLFASTMLNCEGCPKCYSQRTVSLEAETANLAGQKTQTQAEIARLTAELEALDADADRTSLTASCQGLQATLAEIQAKIDAIPGKRAALEEAHRLWVEKEAANRAAEAAREAEEARRETGVIKALLTQIARAPDSIKFSIEKMGCSREHMSAVKTLLQAENFAGLRVTHATLGLTLVPGDMTAASVPAGTPSDGIAVKSDSE